MPMSGIPIRRKPLSPFGSPWEPEVKGYIRKQASGCERLTTSGWLKISNDLFFFLKEHGHKEVDQHVQFQPHK